MLRPKICLIGDIVVDVTLKSENQDTKMRLGGIVHAARGLWALNIPYSVAYFAPQYLDNQINEYLTNFGCQEIIKIGNITGAPFVFLIQEVKEVGDQGYEFLLRDDIKVDYYEDQIDLLSQSTYEDYILISGNYDQERLLNSLPGNIHIDVANNINDVSFFMTLKKKLNTIFVSTSSGIFKNNYNGSFKDFTDHFFKHCNLLILKENRGGSRGINFSTKEIFSASSQTSPIMHSVGVGDVFDVCFAVHSKQLTNQQALVLSSWVACEYALTTYPDDFKREVSRVLKVQINDLVNMQGVSLAWELRSKINIYIAAPDFTFVNTLPIEKLTHSLTYHNFKPRRPVIEHGQMEENAPKARKQELFQKDMALLDKCSLLIAVLLFNDPGTLVEIGLAAAKGLPTIVYDPYHIATNCMLTELPTLISHDLDIIISEVFIQSSKLLK